MGAWADFRADLRHTYRQQEDSSALKRWVRVALSQGIWALCAYRFGRFCHHSRIPVLPRLLKPVHLIWSKAVEILTGIKLYPQSVIGPGLYIHNFGGVVVYGDTGRECILVQGAQLLYRGDGRGAGGPTIGDAVYVGAGAKVLGPIHVGDGARIGANAVVLVDVPTGATAVGVPARVIAAPRQSEEAAEAATKESA